MTNTVTIHLIRTVRGHNTPVPWCGSHRRFPRKEHGFTTIHDLVTCQACLAAHTEHLLQDDRMFNREWWDYRR